MTKKSKSQSTKVENNKKDKKEIGLNWYVKTMKNLLKEFNNTKNKI